MSDIKDWSTTADSNNAASPNGFPEGMAPSGVNNSAREVMAAVREHYDNLEWRDWGHTIVYGSATTFTTAVGDGDTTSIYHANRRVQAVGSLTGTIYGTISGSAHTSQTTITVVWDSGSLSNESLTISISIAADQDSIPYTSLADVPVISVIPSTTVMVFYQAAAPTGWTQVATQNDKALRVVSGTGGGTGGTHALSSPPTTSHFHTGPTHNHNWYIERSGVLVDRSYNISGTDVDLSASIEAGGGIATTSSANALNAAFYTSNAAGVTTSEGPVAFAPQYINVIICSKDA